MSSEAVENNIKTFWSKNKDKIIFASKCGAVVLGTILVIDDITQRKQVKELSDKILKQVHKISYLSKQNRIKDERINFLETRCMEKDNFFKRFIAQGTRRGDSGCARQLAYRKQYLLGKNLV